MLQGSEGAAALGEEEGGVREAEGELGEREVQDVQGVALRALHPAEEGLPGAEDELGAGEEGRK